LNANFAESALDYGGALGLGEDTQAILTRGAAKAAARASAKQVDLNILWQEIQVAERARELFIQERADSQLERLLSSNQTLLRENYRRDVRSPGCRQGAVWIRRFGLNRVGIWQGNCFMEIHCSAAISCRLRQ
jgi:hypothetical protein